MSIRSGTSNGSGKSIGSGNSFTRFFKRKDSKDSSSNHINNQTINTSQPTKPSHHPRSESISAFSPVSPTSPTMQLNGHRPSYEYGSTRGGNLGSLSEELRNYQHYQQQLQTELQYPTPGLEGYKQCMHWLQQTCRPVLMKDLEQLNNVPVPVTPANAKHPTQIGGVQDVQVATYKGSQVQIVPMERWGTPQEVLAE
ncbi:hypothetical protein BGZ54_009059, partial [Gamsiella multidivaricata]